MAWVHESDPRTVDQISIYLRFCATIALALSLKPIYSETVTIPAGVPLRVLDHRYRVGIGAKVEGHLISPTFSCDQEVLPVNCGGSGC